MTDNARSVALNPNAPEDERRDAMAELQKSTMPSALSDLIPRSDIQPIIDWIHRDIEDQAMAKALQKPNVIPFPSRAAKEKQPGMQSVWIDDMQISIQGDWFEKPTMFGFDAMRAMVDQTPILSSVIMQRIRQVQRFCRVQESGKGPGFKIALKDKDAQPNEDEKQSIKLMQDFFTNCGWESKPRQRLRLKRDDFTTFMAKLVRDTLTLDAAAIETEFKRDKSLGIDGLYAVDGATIRLCTEEGYQGDDEIYALQVVQGRIRSVYTYDDLIYVPRNPRTDVMIGGYGLSETEYLIRVVTGFLNAFSYNTKYFDSNAIPKGMLNLYGNYTEPDIQAFKRYWNAMVKGVNNQWTLPVMVSKDVESKAEFTAFGTEVNELMFGKWMTLLASMICAIYGMAPDEINIESFTTGTSSLSGSDTEEKIANSKDKGLRPLLAYFENLFTDFIVAEFSDKFVFRWTGLDEEDPKEAAERKKLSMTWDEYRALDDLPAIGGTLGSAPMNPSLIGVWQAENQQQPGADDFGNPDQQGGGDEGDGNDFGDPGAKAQGGGDFGQPPGDDEQAAASEEDDNGEGMQKSYGLPIFKIDA
jgi:hypothetical protein